MFAVIKTGGKQYVVKKGTILQVEKIEAAADEEISITNVILLDDGQNRAMNPKGASVKATVLEQRKADKVIVFKKRRRKNYRRKNGHRQFVTVLKITDIPALN